MFNQDWQQLRATFTKIWGYDNFRTPQGEIIRSILAGKDTVIVMPTGGGKSICFQLPALLQKGLTLVVSPLVALMENQVQELVKLKLPAALLHSELPREKRKQVLQAIEQQKLRLLYLSPETLLSPPVWAKISHPDLEINALILDEAHCLVQWGETFRPAYRRLGAVRPSLLQTKPKGTKIAIAAFTATADPTAQNIINNTLQLQQPETFLINPYRPNLNLKTQVIWTPKGRKQQMLKFIQKHSKQTGLVYVRSRRESEELATWFQSIGYKSEAYHAGLDALQRRQIESNWLNNKTQFVVCTSAFGMGINKADVRWIIHYQAPQLLSEYLQEIGRGGRDGKPSDALIFMSECTGLLNPEDKQRQQFFQEKLAKQYRYAESIVKKIPQQGNIEAVKQQFKDGEVVLGLLHSTGNLQWLDPFNYRFNLTNFSKLLQQLQNYNQQSTKLLNSYLKSKECRWQFLLNAFGFQQEARGLKCGHCDNCLRK